MIPITTFAGRTVAVFGLARSGIVAAEALRAGGAEVVCWDDGDVGRAAAAKAGLPLVDFKAADWGRFAALVLAPGVPLTHPKPHWTVAKAQAAETEIIGDVELFFRERAKRWPDRVEADRLCPVIAITGTNGKSTTTALIAHILRSAGADVQMGGNIGVGVLALAPPAPGRHFVIELSSFQIDLTPSLMPTVGVLLNITPDHLDRHGTMESYATIKKRLVAGARHAVIGDDDAWCRAFSSALLETGQSVTRISSSRPVDVYVDAGRVRARVGADVVDVADIRHVGSLRGEHNGQNAAAAYAALAALQIPSALIAAGLGTFPGLAHRLEELGRVGRAVIVNDSKGTNADSTEKALASFSGDIYWIAGGVPKEGGIEGLAPYFSRVTRAYLIGQCAPDFARTLDGKVAYELCGTLDVALASAVRDAAQSSAAEPVVLLSPACASYDQYQSFEHRGDHFRALAAAVPGFITKGHA